MEKLIAFHSISVGCHNQRYCWAICGVLRSQLREIMTQYIPMKSCPKYPVYHPFSSMTLHFFPTIVISSVLDHWRWKCEKRKSALDFVGFEFQNTKEFGTRSGADLVKMGIHEMRNYS